MNYEHILTEERGKIFILTMNRPAARNALNSKMWEEIADALMYFEHHDKLRAMIITNNGPSFCAGSDLKEIARGENHPPRGWENSGFAAITGHFCPKPIIAAVNGLAYGGGCEIMMAADLAVISSDGKIALPETHVGLLAAGGGGLLKIGRSIPLKFAAEMVLTGDPVDAQTALQWGLVNRVVEPGTVVDEAIKLAERILRNSPAATAKSKYLLYDSMDKSFMNLSPGWYAMIHGDLDIKGTPEAIEGGAAFAEKRDPSWMND